MTYIICTQNRSRPKVKIKSCEDCGKVGACPDYNNYVQPPLFPGILKMSKKRVRWPKPINAEASGIPYGPEQLLFPYIEKEIPKAGRE
jgi:hypothetical protein